MQGNTQFNCIDYDSSSEVVVVGGSSTSSDIVSDATTPILATYSITTGALNWAI